MPYSEFETFLNENLFSQVDETVSYFAEVRKYLYHFLCLYSRNKMNYSNGYKRKLDRPTNDTGLLFIYCLS